ncbi:MAG: bile acid:sodium symporter family protein [Akkermansiaceae bacterium]
MKRIAEKLSEWFPLWIVLGCLWAWCQPAAWTWFQPWISAGLGVIMLGMGLTLRFADFREVLRQPKWISIGVGLQFLIMPASAFLCSKVFGLNKELALGLILVGCCPGGTASNVICYLARANVALSVLLTMCSTFIAVFLTPLLTQWLAGQLMPIDAWALFRSMIEVVLIPLVSGLIINTFLDRSPYREKSHHWIGVLGPLLSVVVIVLVVGSIVAGRKAEIASAGLLLFFAVFGMHALGFLLGYIISRACGGDKSASRTVSVEVGMQNSGLGATLAKQHFSQLAMAPVPAAISAVFHSLIGSFLAWWWSRSKPSSDK